MYDMQYIHAVNVGAMHEYVVSLPLLVDLSGRFCHVPGQDRLVETTSEFSNYYQYYEIILLLPLSVLSHSLFCVGICEVEPTPKGWFIRYVDRSPAVLAREQVYTCTYTHTNIVLHGIMHV